MSDIDPSSPEPRSIFSGANAIERLEDMTPVTPLAGTVVAVGTSTVLSFIPVFGGPLTAALTGTVEAVTAKKIESWSKEVAIRLDIVCEAVADLDFRVAAADPRFSAAVMATYQQVITEHDETKIRWLANAAVNSGSWVPLDDARQRYFLNLALSWQPEQMHLLTVLRDDFSAWLAERFDRWSEQPNPRLGNFLAGEIYGDNGPWELRRFHDDYASIANTEFVDEMPAQLDVPNNKPTYPRARLTPLGEEFYAFLHERLLPEDS